MQLQKARIVLGIDAYGNWAARGQTDQDLPDAIEDIKYELPNEPATYYYIDVEVPYSEPQVIKTILQYPEHEQQDAILTQITPL